MLHEIAALREKHFPNPPASVAELDAFEAAHGFALDEDLREFYLACNGASLFRRVDAPYRIVPLGEIVPGRTAIFGPWTDDVDGHGVAPTCPTNVFAFIDTLDGDYVGFEVRPGRFAIVDMFHEVWPKEQETVAASFEEFLRRALAGPPKPYWLAGHGAAYVPPVTR